MSESPPISQGALVVYRGRPAYVEQVGPRLALWTADGKRVRVRPKDVVLLHPGPVSAPPRLPTEIDWPPLLEAWEVLQGEDPITLAELAALAYGDYTPATAWTVWQALQDGLYFEGTPEALQARSPEDVEALREQREQRQRQREAWHAFLARAKQGQVDPEADAAFLREVEELALGQRHRSRVLEALGVKQTPVEAHRLLLQWGIWSPRVNPYPARYGIPLHTPEHPLPELPEESRLDLTALPAWAIDDAGSQDPDDALSWDGERIWVHVADVAALVTPDSPADLEARHRGSSVYLPEGVIPMLPDAARERLGLGLQPISPALSFGLRLDGQGQIQDVIIRPTWVKVQRLTYEEAEALLDQDPNLARLWEWARRYAARR
ncbi:MAG: RNB domain-containing ribonuclease, partial [Chloroflexi bacterium]|nr:RNB domain-containing ribonuclease [Chloroflexota bacterium]